MPHNPLDLAADLDSRDHLRAFRDQFHIPRRDNADLVYLTGNSLGLMPRSARRLVDQELDDWASLAVDAHFHGKSPWFPYHEQFREPGARLVGARPGEVVMMNSLTVNLHLMLVSFYRPTARRFKILFDTPAFPSDEYALASQARFHNLDPASALVRLAPRPGESSLRPEDIDAAIAREGDSLALVLLAGVNYVTGQAFDLARVSAAAHAVGAIAGFDLAHAAGNLHLRLHDADADFAVWCSYKYLNAGPGSIAGCFVHQRHSPFTGPRFEGWWGNRADTRFQMRPDFAPATGVEAWQLSNPPILSAAPLRASLDLFDRAGLPALREKSLRLTSFLQSLLDDLAQSKPGAFSLVTPRDPDSRGCQFSLAFPAGARDLQQALQRRGVIADFREPNILRLAPVPLYNSFADCARFALALRQLLA